MRTFYTILLQLVLTLLVEKCGTQESTTDGPTTTSIPILHLDEKNITWNPRSSVKVQIECDPGYRISVTIVDCSINGTNQEFATISSGNPGESLMLTYKVSNKPSYFFNTNLLNAIFSGTDSSNLTVVFSRAGELPVTTTTELPASTIFLPVPASNDSYELVVHITGRDPHEYKNNDTLDSFKDMVSQMAQEYCETQNFELVDNITINNVKIIEIVTCSSGYQTCDSCAEVRLAVPVHTKDDSTTWSGYQLNGQHLRFMWDRFSSKYFRDGIKTCPQDLVNDWIKWQIVLVAVTTVGFLALLLILRFWAIKIIKNAKKKNRQMNDNISRVPFEDKLSKISLPPHYLQETPALFDNTYPMYKPGLGSTNAAFEQYGDEIKENEFTETEPSDTEEEIEESGA